MNLKTIIKQNIREQLKTSDWETKDGLACTSCFNEILTKVGGYNQNEIIEEIKSIMIPNSTIESLAEDMSDIVYTGDEEKNHLAAVGLLACISSEECTLFIPHLKSKLTSLVNQNPEETQV